MFVFRKLFCDSTFSSVATQHLTQSLLHFLRFRFKKGWILTNNVKVVFLRISYTDNERGRLVPFPIHKDNLEYALLHEMLPLLHNNLFDDIYLKIHDIYTHSIAWLINMNNSYILCLF